MRRARVTLFAGMLFSCGSSPEAAPTSPCAANEVFIGACAPKFDECGPLEAPIAGGGCAATGVPKDGCAEGFRWADGGCVAILPPAPCPKGEIAIPGDEKCREVAPCADGRWGGIPDEPSTLYVDQAYVGSPEVGTKTQPFKTIDAAIAAADGAKNPIVAIAAGKYVGNLTIDKKVRLYGRCPSLVELSGVGPDDLDGAVSVSASGVELHRVSITGVGLGVAVANAGGIVLDEVWIHDTGYIGIGAVWASKTKTTDITLRGSLVEKVTNTGVVSSGAIINLDRSVVRDTVAKGDGAGEPPLGIGVNVVVNPICKVRGSVNLTRSMIERNAFVGVIVVGSDATIDASVIRDTSSDVNKEHGHGVKAAPTDEKVPDTKPRVTITASVLERNRDVSVELYDGTFVIDRTTIRDTLAEEKTKVDGAAIAAINGDLTVRDSLVERARAIAVFASAQNNLFEGLLVRDTLAQEVGSEAGIAMAAVYSWDASAVYPLASPPVVTVRRTLLSTSRLAGVMSVGSQISFEGVAIRDIAAASDGRFGDGLLLVPQVVAGGVVVPSRATLDGCSFTNVARAGASAFDSDATLGRTLFRCAGIDFDLSGKYPGVEHGATHAIDAGGNSCGCGAELRACIGSAAELEIVPLPGPPKK